MSRVLPADLAGLKAIGCDALVVAGYPWLIKGWERHLPYAVNFHPSPLPVGRGPYPLFQAILDSLPEWGMTAHLLETAFDTGAIVAQKRFYLNAAETHDTLDNARQKRRRKGLDLIVVNDVSDTRIGFNSELNAVTLVAADGETTLPMAPKAEIARQLIERIADLHRARAVGATAERGLPLRALD